MPQRTLPFVAALAAAAPAVAQLEVSDATFNENDWSHSVLYSRGTVTLGPMSQSLAGGNPDAFQHGRHTSDGAFASIWDGHLYTPGVYNPAAQGEIESVDIRYDVIDLLPGSIQSGLLVSQGGRTFFFYVDANDHSSWAGVGADGITGTDAQWQEASPGGISTAHPDFSAAGAPITFGYYTFNWSLPTGFFIEREWGIDNFRITIHAAGNSCYANCDGSTAAPILNVNDFICFQGRFAAGDSYANCDGSAAPPILNVNDFVCFMQKFAAGCF